MQRKEGLEEKEEIKAKSGVFVNREGARRFSSDCSSSIAGTVIPGQSPASDYLKFGVFGDLGKSFILPFPSSKSFAVIG